MVGAARTALTALTALVGTLALCFTATVSAAVQLLTSTLLVMGGNENPAGLTPNMQQEIGGNPWYPATNNGRLLPAGVFGQGYIDTQNNAASPYYGWNFTRVEWPAVIWPWNRDSWTYETAAQQGMHNIDRAISAVLPTLAPGESTVAFGYSSSANVMVREMRALQNQPGGATDVDQLDFFLMGNPNRPNGGIMQRFPHLYVPVLDIPLDGSTPTDTPYTTTDLSWEYDTAADFPNYPLNLLAVLNSALAGPLLHGNYFRADFYGPRALPDTTVGNITYITLEPPHLPLLLPLYDLGFPKAPLDLIEPALTVMVDWGYNRSISPGTPQRFQLIPRVNPITATVDLVKAIGQGVQNFCDDLKPAPAAPSPAPAVAPSPARAIQMTAAPRQAEPARALAPRSTKGLGKAARTAKPAAAVTTRPSRAA